MRRGLWLVLSLVVIVISVIALIHYASSRKAATVHSDLSDNQSEDNSGSPARRHTPSGEKGTVKNSQYSNLQQERDHVIKRQVGSNKEAKEQVSVSDLDSSDSSVRSKAALGLYDRLGQMTDHKLSQFWQALQATTSKYSVQSDWLDMTWVLSNVAATMKEREMLTQQQVDTALKFLSDVALDIAQTPENRRAAIQAIGMAGATGASPSIAVLLKDPQNWNSEEIARSAVVALAKLKHPEAVPVIAQVISNTKSTQIGDSAAYALGETGQIEAIVPLVAYREATGSNLSPDTAMRKMRPQIIEGLQNNQSTIDQRTAMIKATTAFFDEDHDANLDYLKSLGDLVAGQSIEPELRRAASRQLLQYAKMADWQTGNKILESLMPSFESIPGFETEFRDIQNRINATPLRLDKTETRNE